eukprot:902805-Rhodomonas_salina.1
MMHIAWGMRCVESCVVFVCGRYRLPAARSKALRRSRQYPLYQEREQLLLFPACSVCRRSVPVPALCNLELQCCHLWVQYCHVWLQYCHL